MPQLFFACFFKLCTFFAMWSRVYVYSRFFLLARFRFSYIIVNIMAALGWSVGRIWTHASTLPGYGWIATHCAKREHTYHLKLFSVSDIFLHNNFYSLADLSSKFKCFKYVCNGYCAFLYLLADWRTPYMIFYSVGYMLTRTKFFLWINVKTKIYIEITGKVRYFKSLLMRTLGFT